MQPIYGFTFLRDGVRHDYSFRESLISLSKLCKKIYVALGKNDDGTAAALSDLDFLEIIPTVWDMSKMGDGGLIFSEQTNIALEALRANHRNEPHAWGVYLQCDEVIHEREIELIRNDFKKAENEGADVVSFRYLHFWQDHDHIAINRIWYPQEVRGIKLDSAVESWGDAQSFRKFTKRFETDAFIHHYGHVRDQEKYLEKKASIIKYIRAGEKLSKYIRRETNSHKNTEAISYLGDHPIVMKDRMERLGGVFSKGSVEKVYIVGDKKNYKDNLTSRINAKAVCWLNTLKSVPSKERKNAIIVSPSFFQKLLYPSNVPGKMRSKFARQWNKETILLLKLSEKGVGINPLI